MGTSNTTLAWVDIETTGTDEHCDAILELGIVLTPMPEQTDDPDYVAGWNGGVPDIGVLRSFSMAFRPSRDVKLSNISPYVWAMHEESGLWSECMTTKATFNDVIDEAKLFLKQNGAEGSPMCGNSIHFDRRFLTQQARDFCEMFHYRNLDVSSIKNMVLHHLGAFVDPWRPPEKKAHRVLDDLHNTLEEYRYYLGALTGKKMGAIR
jgi:oligoribonuclease